MSFKFSVWRHQKFVGISHYVYFYSDKALMAIFEEDTRCSTLKIEVQSLQIHIFAYF
jgi:hypothetical protein